MRSLYEPYQDVRELMTVFPDGTILPMTEDLSEDGSLVALGFWEAHLLQPLVDAFYEKCDLWNTDPESATFSTGYFQIDDDDEDGYRDFHEVESINDVPSGAVPVTLVVFS